MTKAELIDTIADMPEDAEVVYRASEHDVYELFEAVYDSESNEINLS